ncbi:MAG TPA: hypothetical protein VNE58_06345 [Casimicrobiaceae bacterium]|nr:hypothetical protein [Casimicrobiaceae bacterium]
MLLHIGNEFDDVYALRAWTELDIRRYVKRERIPICKLHFARDGRRFRSLGERGITLPIASNADSIDAIIDELANTTIEERAVRSMDHEREDAFERLRASGSM